MSKWIWTGLIKAIVEMIRKLFERRALERTSDAQAENDARDRGDAGDIAGRLRDRANRERDAGGGMPPSDERGGADKGS